MRFDDSPDVEVLRTEGGELQSLDHTQQPWPPTSGDQLVEGPSDPRSAAEQYLKQVAPEYKVSPDLTSLTDSGFDLKLEPDKTRFKSTAVIYRQTFNDWPLWDAQLSVTVRDEDNRVVNSSSTLHTNAPRPDLPPRDAKYLNNPVKEEDISQSLGVPMDGNGISFTAEYKENTQRILVYRYSAKGRQEQAGDSPPLLAFPEVHEKIQDGHYYVVREALFSSHFLSLAMGNSTGEHFSKSRRAPSSICRPSQLD